jgi:hypothetical protein
MSEPWIAPVVHWQKPGTEDRAACHGQKSRPVTAERAEVTCGACRQSRVWLASLPLPTGLARGQSDPGMQEWVQGIARSLHDRYQGRA